MANNTTEDMQDGYIILGVEDKTFNITGIGGDSNRKNQENIIEFLSSKIWAGEEIPSVEVKTINISAKDIDVIIIHNRINTPYFLLNDYEKTIDSNKTKTIIRAGVIYSRVGDRNTSSADCATKQATEFLWKKRLGMVGTDEYKVVKRLQNIESWYSIDEYDTFYNNEYSDIIIKRDCDYDFNVTISETNSCTNIWVMDFPYLFTNIINWDIGKQETGRRAKWDIFINGRQLPVTLYGVQATRQSYYHIEPKIYWDKDFGITLNSTSDSIQYYAYIKDSIEFLAFRMFLDKQCYIDKQTSYKKALTVIPVFESEQERKQFIEYVKSHIDKFDADIENQDINEMFPQYAQGVNNVIVYKLGKTLVKWLKDWRCKNHTTNKL